MRKLILFLILLFHCIVYKVEAKCSHSPCYSWNPGEENNCGDGCKYNLINGVLSITAGDNAKIKTLVFTEDHYNEEAELPIFRNVVIDGAIKIDSNAFGIRAYNISGANGTLILTGIDHHGFGDYTTLTGNIVIPANATFGSLAFHGVTLAEGAKIYCAVENCAQKMIDSCNAYGDETNEYRVRCLNAAQTIISDEDKFEQAPEGCDFWSSEGCSKCTNSNYSLEYGYCYRKRYTLPEADAATSDDNENMIEWIFE